MVDFIYKPAQLGENMNYPWVQTANKIFSVVVDIIVYSVFHI